MKILIDLDTPNLPEEYAIICRYVIENIEEEKVFNPLRHGLQMIRDDVDMHSNQYTIWRLLIYDRNSYNDFMRRQYSEISALVASQAVSMYYDPDCIYGIMSGPYFEIYNGSYDTERYYFGEYKELYNGFLKFYKAKIGYYTAN